VLHDLDLAVHRLLAVLGQRLAGELVAAAAGPGAADPDGAELALPDLGAELVLALEPLLPPHPRGGVDAAQLALEPAPGAVGRRPRPARGRRRHHHAAAPGGGGGGGGGLLLLGPRLGLAAGALAVAGGGRRVVAGSGQGAGGARAALALPRQRVHAEGIGTLGGGGGVLLAPLACHGWCRGRGVRRRAALEWIGKVGGGARWDLERGARGGEGRGHEEKGGGGGGRRWGGGGGGVWPLACLADSPLVGLVSWGRRLVGSAGLCLC